MINTFWAAISLAARAKIALNNPIKRHFRKAHMIITETIYAAPLSKTETRSTEFPSISQAKRHNRLKLGGKALRRS